VFGDGTASRDFCYVDNVVQANLLAALAPKEQLTDPVFNIACGKKTSLLELFDLIRGLAAATRPAVKDAVLQREAPRAGDILHSLASIERARERLGYNPTFDVARGMQETVRFYAEQVAPSSAPSGSLPVAPASRAAS
jgi:UDP-N-acetylglucosamine 4-epimerase